MLLAQAITDYDRFHHCERTITVMTFNKSQDENYKIDEFYQDDENHEIHRFHPCDFKFTI